MSLYSLIVLTAVKNLITHSLTRWWWFWWCNFVYFICSVNSYDAASCYETVRM